MFSIEERENYFSIFYGKIETIRQSYYFFQVVESLQDFAIETLIVDVEMFLKSLSLKPTGENLEELKKELKYMSLERNVKNV